MKKFSNKKKALIFFVLVFFVILPLALQINFEQNDDWIYYEDLRNFSSGNFSLNTITAPSFYGAGIPALLFSKVFGMQKVPVLTLFVSVGSAYILALILIQHFKKPLKDSILLSLLFLFNPLFAYSTWGFMTENYAVFYMLLSFYFSLGENTSKYKNFILATLFAFLAFNTRQIFIVVPFAFAGSALLAKRLKDFSKYTIISIAFLIYYYTIFPKTPIMFDNNLAFTNLTYFRYLVSLNFIVLIYLCSLLAPIVLLFLKQNFFRKEILFAFLTSLPITVFLNMAFKPTLIWREKYYYIINTVQRRGFLEDNIHGGKSDFWGFPTIYALLDNFGKFIGAWVVLGLILKLKKEILGFAGIFVVLYIGLINISPYIHDRYLVPLFPVTIILIAPALKIFSKAEKLLFFGLLALLSFYTYNFSMDYVLTNKYVWNKSLEISQTQNTEKVEKGEIISTIAWNLKYPSTKKGHEYKFTYDAPHLQNYSTVYSLVEKKAITYPFSFYFNNNVYLYKHNP